MGGGESGTGREGCLDPGEDDTKVAARAADGRWETAAPRLRSTVSSWGRFEKMTRFFQHSSKRGRCWDFIKTIGGYTQALL